MTDITPTEPTDSTGSTDPADSTDPSAPADLVTGDDGRSRCAWGASDPLYVPYHDDEWGRPLHDERALFELLTLEAFQSGLSWLTILRKRRASGWRSRASTRPWPATATADRARLLADLGIVRNGAKVDATIANARATVGLHDAGATLVDLVFPTPHRPRSARPAAVRVPGRDPGRHAPSTALAKELRTRASASSGPVVAYALMQAAGVVDDHLEGCGWGGGGDGGLPELVGVAVGAGHGGDEGRRPAHGAGARAVDRGSRSARPRATTPPARRRRTRAAARGARRPRCRAG